MAGRRVSPPGVLITKSFDKMMRPAYIVYNTTNRQAITRPSLHRLFFDLFLIKFSGLTAPNMAAIIPENPANNSEETEVMIHIASRTNRASLLKAPVCASVAA